MFPANPRLIDQYKARVEEEGELDEEELPAEIMQGVEDNISPEQKHFAVRLAQEPCPNVCCFKSHNLHRFAMSICGTQPWAMVVGSDLTLENLQINAACARGMMSEKASRKGAGFPFACVSHAVLHRQTKFCSVQSL